MPEFFKCRLRFSKTERARFISHLDLMRCFQRSFRRADISLRHSEGFNPHPYLSILAPLSVGFESGCELLDFHLCDGLSHGEILGRLSAALPEGVAALDAYEPVHAVKALAFAGYDVFFEISGAQDAPLQIEAMFSSPEIIVPKKSKSGVRDVNLRDLLRGLAVRPAEGGVKISAALAAAANPVLLKTAVERYLPWAAIEGARYRRTAFLLGDGSPFV